MARAEPAPPRRPKIDADRRALYGKIEIAKKQLGLDDGAYRELLQRRYGKRSRTQLARAELIDLVEHFKRQGFKPAAPRRGRARTQTADHRQAKKMRALWLTLWHLGVVADPTEAALAAFARRVTGGRAKGGIEALQWIEGAPAAKTIEALKDWAARPVAKGGAGVDWSPYQVYVPATDGMPATTQEVEKPRQRVIEAQWRLLHALGWTWIRDGGALARYADRFLDCAAAGGWSYADADALDRLIRHFGEIVRARRRSDRAEEE